MMEFHEERLSDSLGDVLQLQPSCCWYKTFVNIEVQKPYEENKGSQRSQTEYLVHKMRLMPDKRKH